MELPGADTLMSVAVVLIVAAVAWTILRSVLRLTARLFRIGCLALLILVGVIWAAGALS